MSAHIHMRAVKCPFCSRFNCIKKINEKEYFRSLGEARGEVLHDSPYCCELAKGLRLDQFEKMSEIAEDRMKLYAKLGDIACLSCEMLSPVMRKIVSQT